MKNLEMFYIFNIYDFCLHLMVIVLEEGTHSGEETNSSITGKLFDQVSTRSRLISIDSVLFLHF